MVNFIKMLFSSKEILQTGREIAKFFDGDHSKAVMDKYIDSASAPNIARRIVAVIITVVWALITCLWLGLLLAESDKAEVVAAFAQGYVLPPFCLVVTYYFLKRLRLKNGKLTG